MPKVASLPYSHYSRDAAALLGQLIRRARIERRFTVEQLATRAGVSRGLIQRIEKGDLGCSIGAVFEAAAIVGVRLFDADQTTISAAMGSTASVLTLLPKTIHASRTEAKDDF